MPKIKVDQEALEFLQGIQLEAVSLLVDCIAAIEKVEFDVDGQCPWCQDYGHRFESLCERQGLLRRWTALESRLFRG